MSHAQKVGSTRGTDIVSATGNTKQDALNHHPAALQQWEANKKNEYDAFTIKSKGQFYFTEPGSEHGLWHAHQRITWEGTAKPQTRSVGGP